MKKMIIMAFAVCMIAICGGAFSQTIEQTEATELNVLAERVIEGDVYAGETFEVKLVIDVDENNMPRTYVLAEEIPEGFEIVDTDARVTTEDKIMKWVEIDGLFGKIEDTEHVYQLTAPTMPGEYEIMGRVTLTNKTSIETSGVEIISVKERQPGEEATGMATGTSSDGSSTTNMALLGIGGLAIIAIAYLAYRKFSGKKKKDEKVEKKGEMKDEKGADETNKGEKM